MIGSIDPECENPYYLKITEGLALVVFSRSVDFLFLIWRRCWIAGRGKHGIVSLSPRSVVSHGYALFVL